MWSSLKDSISHAKLCQHLLNRLFKFVQYRCICLNTVGKYLTILLLKGSMSTTTAKQPISRYTLLAIE